MGPRVWPEGLRALDAARVAYCGGRDQLRAAGHTPARSNFPGLDDGCRLVGHCTFTHGQELVIDARAAGLAIGAVALWFGAPTAVALLLAAIVCAIVRFGG